jgi:hypothetical protein
VLRIHAIERIVADAPLDILPLYTCSVEKEGILGMKHELSTPFQMATNRQWNDVYVVLRGTQLNIHRIKNPGFLSKNRKLGPNQLIKSYSLQHAEVGLAADFKKTELVPRSPFAHLVPVTARKKVFETDPHLFEPVREFVLRLRVETEQILLCVPNQGALLDWVEALCAAVDIASPLDDRCEPRYRSLPRRSRRQRALDGTRLPGDLDNISNVASGRRLVEEQARIIAQLYPNLAASYPITESVAPEQPVEAPVTHNSHESEQAHANSDPEADDLDPADFQDVTSRPLRSPAAAHASPRTQNPDSTAESTELTQQITRTSTVSTTTPSDCKAPPRQPSTNQALRYRRRCAPILLSSSPRASDVVYSAGKRMRINVKDFILVDYTPLPPRYDAHAFPRAPMPVPTPEEEPVTAQTTPAAASQVQRPISPQRGLSGGFIAHSLSSLDEDGAAFGYDLASTSSAESPDYHRHNADDITSEPPSPTIGNAPRGSSKADAARGMLRLGKVRTSDEGPEMGGLSAAFSVGMLI